MRLSSVGRLVTGKAATERLLFLMLLAAVGWSYVADKFPGGFIAREANGYYLLLTEAIPAGRVNLNIVADVRFLRLADPYAGPQGTNRPHDMSFYRGKFYIYYGITPVLLLMLPWHIFTGTFLTEPATTALFCFGGFILGAWWLWRLRARLCPSLGFGWFSLLVLGWGWGTPVVTLAKNTTFYAVPIGAAFFCAMAVVTAVDLALAASRRTPALLGLAAASLMHGLAVGARPIYAFSLPLLLLPAFVLWRRHGGLTAVLLATILPAAFVGAGLAAYNFVRFENPFEFGIRYTLSTVSQTTMRLMGLEFIPKNLSLYLLQPAEFIRYFPFVYNDSRPFGLLPHWPVAAMGLLVPFTLLSLRVRRDAVWPTTAPFVLSLAIVNLFSLSLFFGEVDRYLSDYVPLALLAALGSLLLLPALGMPSFLRRGVMLAGGVAGAWTLFNGLAFALNAPGSRPSLTFVPGVEWTTNTIAYQFERIGSPKYGPLEADITFPDYDPSRPREPILSTGHLRQSGDIIFIVNVDADHVRFGYFHLGSGGPIGDPVRIQRGRRYRLQVELGSLYPASLRHPVFLDWNQEQIAALLRKLEIRLDGVVVLQSTAAAYPSTPGGVRPGRNDLAADVSAANFRGHIENIRRLPLPRPEDFSPQLPAGPVTITFRLPSEPSDNFQPLICTGRSGSGDLLGLQYQSDGRIRFLHDCWGAGAFYSEPVLPGSDPDQVLEVDMGSLHPAPPTGAPNSTRRFRLRLNGQVVADTERPFNPSTPGQVVFGYNAIGGGTTQQMFSGSIRSVRPSSVAPTSTSSQLP
jgi:hypothetical protein